MSVNQTSRTDTSTSNANWGTLVIVLVVVIIAAVVGLMVHSGSQNATQGAINVTTTTPGAR